MYSLFTNNIKKSYHISKIQIHCTYNQSTWSNLVTMLNSNFDPWTYLKWCEAFSEIKLHLS